MPISRMEFEKQRAEDSTEVLVVNFLGAHNGEAFSAQEISSGIGHSSAPPSGNSQDASMWRSFRIWTFDEELKGMARRGLFDERVVKKGEGEDRYYSAKK